jgi:hypothetical protein
MSNYSNFPPLSPYYQRLHPWCIVRHLPQMQRLLVCRFRQRSQAEAHLRILRQLAPAPYEILFDPGDGTLEFQSEQFSSPTAESTRLD